MGRRYGEGRREEYVPRASQLVLSSRYRGLAAKCARPTLGGGVVDTHVLVEPCDVLTRVVCDVGSL